MTPLLAAGALSLLTQVVLLRELSVAYYGVELIYIIAFGVWLLGSGIGSLTSPAPAKAGSPRLPLLFIILSLLLPLDIAFIRASRLIAGAVPGAYLALPVQLVILGIALLPISLLAGWLFIHSAANYAARGGRLSSAYALECAGALAGGLATTALLHWGVGNLSQGLLCGLLAAATSVLITIRDSRAIPKSSITVAGMFLIALVAAPSADRWMTGWTHPALLESRDTPYGRLTITGEAGQFVVYENDELAHESQSASAEEFALVAALQIERCDSVLIIGGGVEGLAPELLRLYPRYLEYVELNPALLSALKPALENPQAYSVKTSDLTEQVPSALDWLDDPRVHLTIADPRRFLSRGDRCYDLILSAMPQPTSGQTNRYYTEEYFQQCKERLKPGGVFAFRLRSAENLWTPALAGRNAGIYRALCRIFPSTLVLPGTTNIFLASPDSLLMEPARLGERLRARNIPTQMVTPDYISYLYTNDRVDWMRRMLDSTAATANSDAKPAAYSYGLLLWLAKFHPELALLRWGTEGGGVLFWTLLAGGIIIAALVVRLVAGSGSLLRRGSLMGAAGLAGMFLETLLLLDYQTRLGVLYQNIGLLLTLFMAGMALGAWLAGLATQTVGTTKSGGNYSAMASLALMTVAGGIAIGMQAIALSPVMMAMLLLGVGFLVGAVFSVAVSVPNGRQSRALSIVYAADLLGGCLGSWAAVLAAIPFLGFSGAAGVAAILALAALVIS